MALLNFHAFVFASQVVTVLSKRGDVGIEPLTASSLLQMAGRAGRRGQVHVVCIYIYTYT